MGPSLELVSDSSHVLLPRNEKGHISQCLCCRNCEQNDPLQKLVENCSQLAPVSQSNNNAKVIMNQQAAVVNKHSSQTQSLKVALLS